jgi:hypothetical protein
MYRHGPSCLEGPASRTFARWSKRARHRHIRWELVERVRREIAEGTYESPEKLEIAMDRLLDHVQGCDPQ